MKRWTLPIVPSLTRKSIIDWFKKADIKPLIALGIAFIVYVLAYCIAHTGGASIPPGFELIRLTDYHQAYDIYRKGTMLILERTRDGQQAPLIAFFSLISVSIIYQCIATFLPTLRKQQSPGNRSRIGGVLLVFAWSILMYFLAYPSIVVITEPQTLILDLDRNQALLNGKIVSNMNAIAGFEDEERHGAKSASSRFGIRLKDGSYLELTSGTWVGGNLPLINAYLNQYLQAH